MADQSVSEVRWEKQTSLAKGLPQGKGVELSKRWLWGVGVCLGIAAWLAAGGCTAMRGSYWGPSGGGFVRVFGDSGPSKPFGPDTVSEWMAQPRPKP